ILRINDLNKNKDAKLIEKIKNYVRNDILIKVNKKLYIINEHNDKLSIKTDAEKQLLYKHSNISFKKKENIIKINIEIIYNIKLKVLLSLNTKKNAVIIRRNAANNISIGNLTRLKIYKTFHKFKIEFARCIAAIYKFFYRKNKINVYFEKEASKAVESGKYVFEAVADNKKLKSQNIFILDKKSEQYPEMKKSGKIR